MNSSARRSGTEGSRSEGLMMMALPQASAGPAFGSKIAFTSDRDEPNVSAEIYVVNADGTGLINLTNHASDDTRPDWSPDGTLIAFQSNRHGNPEIYVMHADGSDGTNPRRLTVSPDRMPRPTGHRMARASPSRAAGMATRRFT